MNAFSKGEMALGERFLWGKEREGTLFYLTMVKESKGTRTFPCYTSKLKGALGNIPWLCKIFFWSMVQYLIAVWDYAAEGEFELSFKQGDRIKLLEKHNDDW